jgi:hypothetical protein
MEDHVEVNQQGVDASASELLSTVKTVIMASLDDESWLSTWNIGSSQYYTRLAHHICEKDKLLVGCIKDMMTLLRSTYRSYIEHQQHIALVPLTRQQSEFLTDKCCICLNDLGDWRRVIRLKSSNENPKECGHRLHASCAAKMHIGRDGMFRCPVCRATIGPNLRHWGDTENKQPLF